MPLANQMPDTLKTIKMCVIGNSKVGKTHYAAQAAADGFKVLYIDGDVSIPTISQFDDDAKQRIFHLPFGDQIDDNGAYIPRFSLLLRKFLSSGKMMWHDEKSRTVIDKKDAGDPVVELNAAGFDHEWVIVIDSWTSVAHSIMSLTALNAGVDLADMDKASMSIYGNANNLATDLLSRIKNLRSHVIVIAHPDEFIKYKVKKGNVQDNMRTANREVESARLIPKSTSRPHGLTMAKHFTDVAWIEVTPMGKRIINFESSPDHEGGGRFDGKLPIDEGAFARLVKRAGGQVPVDAKVGSPSDALVFIPEYEAKMGRLTGNPSIVNPNPANAPAQVKLGAAPKTTASGLAPLSLVKQK